MSVELVSAIVLLVNTVFSGYAAILSKNNETKIELARIAAVHTERHVARQHAETTAAVAELADKITTGKVDT